MRKFIIAAVLAAAAPLMPMAQTTITLRSNSSAEKDLHFDITKVERVEFTDEEFTDFTQGGNPSTPVVPDGFVDLGLPSGTLWASDYFGTGDLADRHYHWGEMQPSKAYAWSVSSAVQRYYNHPLTHSTQLLDEYNVVKRSLGNNYDYPTVEQAQELYDNVEIVYQEDYNGKSGLLLTSKINGNSIFLEETIRYFKYPSYNGALVPVTTMDTNSDKQHASFWTKDIHGILSDGVKISTADISPSSAQTNYDDIAMLHLVLPVYNPETAPEVKADQGKLDQFEVLNDFVDLGLPSGTKWSTQYLFEDYDINKTNNGGHKANDPKFSWGMPDPIKNATSENYDGSFTETITAINNPVYKALGLGFDMPTIEQFNELINPEYTDIQVDKSGYIVARLTITSKINGKKLVIRNPGIGKFDDAWNSRDPSYGDYTPIFWLKEASGKKDGIYDAFKAYAGFFLDTNIGGFYNPATKAGAVELPAWFPLAVLPVYNGDFVDTYRGIEFKESSTFSMVSSRSVLYGLPETERVETKMSELVDDPQYGGDFLYGGKSDNYVFKHEATGLVTGLRAPVCKYLNIPYEPSAYGDYYYSGGVAISNYWSTSFDEANYSTQLTAYFKTKRTTPFLMLYGYNDIEQTAVSYDSRPIMGFEEERRISSLSLCYPTYLLNSLAYGDGFNSAASDDTEIYLIIEGFDSNNQSLGSCKYTIYNKDLKDVILEKGTIVIDTSNLPQSHYYLFNMDATPDQKGPNGLNTPAYIGIFRISVDKVTYQK